MSTTQTLATPASGASGRRLSILFRPGITFPNWSVVTSETVCQALDSIFEVFGIEQRWTGIEDAEDRVRRAVLDLYARLGHAPSITQLAEATAIAPDEVRGLVRKLRARDLIVLDETGETVVGAYPFRDRDTGHRVHLGDRVLNAMCAIDALGVGAMYDKDVTIDSVCAACGSEIRITTRDNGAAVDEVSPPSTVVWSGIRYADACAADSLCTVLAFFCSDEHLESWRKSKHPDVKGFRLSLDEGMQAGKAIFTPLLALDSPPAS